ncbi:MAG: hypothetical protein LBR83_05100 [Clostridiales bacterium]|jgi:hypothetical protein|nr:hypothetical protein [Clostridiales bacterium]
MDDAKAFKPTPANRGTLMLNATAAPADIRYPKSLSNICACWILKRDFCQTRKRERRVIAVLRK